MTDIKTLLERAYSAFNKRDIDGALALMTQDVSWPKASEGGKVTGKEEVRAYWTRQWVEYGPAGYRGRSRGDTPLSGVQAPRTPGRSAGRPVAAFGPASLSSTVAYCL